MFLFEGVGVGSVLGGGLVTEGVRYLAQQRGVPSELF